MNDDEQMKRGHGHDGLPRVGIQRRGSSGGHPIMQAVRKKLASIREGQLPELEALNARIDRACAKVKSDTSDEDAPDESRNDDDERDSDESDEPDTIPGRSPGRSDSIKKEP